LAASSTPPAARGIRWWTSASPSVHASPQARQVRESRARTTLRIECQSLACTWAHGMGKAPRVGIPVARGADQC